MGVVTDVQQAASPCRMKSPTRALSPIRALSPSRKDVEESQALSPNRKDVDEQSEASIASSPSSPPPTHFPGASNRRDSRRASLNEAFPRPELKVPARAFNVPTYVRVGGVALGLIAGNVNSIAFLALGSFVSHQTGSWARVGMGNMQALLLVSSFIFGSLICGLLVTQKIIPVRVALYDICLIIEAGLLVAATFLAEHDVAVFLVAMACGLQNGVGTHWGGAAVRNTHVTGLFTDVGLLIGRLLTTLARCCCSCGELSAADKATTADDLSKLSLLGSIALAFLFGIFLGTHSYSAIGANAFLIPAAAVGFVGCVYFCYRFLGRCFSSDKAMEMEKDLEAGKVDGAVEKGSEQSGNNTVSTEIPEEAVDGQEAEKTVAV